MPRLDDLAPDLRATLSLLVDRGKSYAQVAELLGISEDAVRERAHLALDTLAGAPGQAAGTGAPRPSVTPKPFSGAEASLESAKAGALGVGARPFGARPGAGAGVASRRGGAIVLAAIAVVVVVVAVALATGGGSEGGSSGSNSSASTGAPSGSGSNGGSATGASSPTGATSATGTGSSSTGTKARVTNQITLASPDPASKTIGIAEILAEGSQHAIYIAAEHIPPTHGFFYVLWLYNSPTSAQAIGKTTVGSTARLQAGALLPANAGNYHQLLLTRETEEHPAQPGPTVLSGSFSLGH